MPLNIKDPATEKFVRELAALTGETVTAAIRHAAEERLQRVRRKQTGRSLAEELLAIGKRGVLRSRTRTCERPTKFLDTTGMACQAPDGHRYLGSRCFAVE